MYAHVCLHCKEQPSNTLNTFVLPALAEIPVRTACASGRDSSAVHQRVCTSGTGTNPSWNQRGSTCQDPSDNHSLDKVPCTAMETDVIKISITSQMIQCNGNWCLSPPSLAAQPMQYPTTNELYALQASPLSIVPEADHIYHWSNLSKNKVVFFNKISILVS